MALLDQIPGISPVISPEKYPQAKGVAVVGLHEGQTLLTTMQTRCRYARAVAGCDLSAEKITKVREDRPDLFYTRSIDELLQRDDVDILAIYTPDHLHAEHIIGAFEAGKDVICSKPLVNSLESAARVLEVGRRTGRHLLVGQSTRFFEPFRRQRADVEAGRYGGLDGIELLDAHYIHRMDWFYRKSPWAATDSDWVFMGMSHPIDLVRWYLGRIAQVSAFASRSTLGSTFNLKGNDICIANFVAADGRIGRAMGHYGCHELPTARNAIELMLYGSGGTSLAQYHDMRYIHTSDDRVPQLPGEFDPGSHGEIIEDYLYAGRHYYFNSEIHGMHYGECANYADYFAKALIEAAPYSPGLEEAVETYCVMEAVKRSADTQRLVEVAPLLREVGLN